MRCVALRSRSAALANSAIDITRCELPKLSMTWKVFSTEPMNSVERPSVIVSSLAKLVCPFTSACGKAAHDALFAEANTLGLIDTAKKAAIGYCAGGGYVLEQARDGLDFKAVVVFHVTNPNPVIAGTPCNIKGRVLAVHGAADPITPKPMMDAFEKELAAAKVDWEIMMFGGGVHSFCDLTANTDATRYDEKLCRKSYMLMRDFFAETL